MQKFKLEDREGKRCGKTSKTTTYQKTKDPGCEVFWELHHETNNSILICQHFWHVLDIDSKTFFHITLIPRHWYKSEKIARIRIRRVTLHDEQ